MKKTIIEAFNGIGKDKVLAGRREVDEPETLEEARTLDSDADIRDYYWSAKTIEIQRQIRAGTTVSAKQQLSAILAAAKNNPDLMKLVEAVGIKVVEVPADETDKKEVAPSAPENQAETSKPARNRK